MADEKDDETKNEDLNAPLVFDEEQRERDVKVGTGEYILREMMGDALGKWQGFEQTRMKISKGRVEMQPEAFEKFAAVLINLCLFDKATNVAVPVVKIQKWRSTIITGLYDACRDLNGLSPDGQDQAKKA